jgi:hypothetical protein
VATAPLAARYARHRPEQTTLYAVVRDNLETLYGAVDDGALGIALPEFVRGELEGYLACGMLCRGFARLRCEGCSESRLVAFSCKGRGFCPSCLGRRMCATAANLVERVLPPAPLRQWVLTFPFPWRKRLAYDAKLTSALTRIFVTTVLAFYRNRLTNESGAKGQSGAIVVVQRTSSDLKLNPHLHVVFLDGTYREVGEHVLFHELPHLRTRDVADVLARATARMRKYLRHRGLLEDDDDEHAAPEGIEALAASAASGQAPPAGPEWRRGTIPLPRTHAPLSYDKPLCAALDGFTLHAATRAGALDAKGREALLKYILRPALAQERITRGPNGLVRIALKRAFSDGTTAIDLDPLSLLCRLAASVPAPRAHTVKYAGVLAAASKLRPKIAPRLPHPSAEEEEPEEPLAPRVVGSRYRPWPELLRRTFEIDVLSCTACGGRMRLVALLTETKSVARFLKAIGEPTELPARAPARGPPYWKSTVLRRAAGHGADDVSAA